MWKRKLIINSAQNQLPIDNFSKKREHFDIYNKNENQES